MRFLTKLFAFACALVAVILIFDLGDRGDRRDVKRHYARAARAPLPPRAATAPREMAVPVAATATVDAPHDVRIVTTNGVAFLALRGDAMVAGLSDSIRQLVARELKSDRASATGLEGKIETLVRSSVGKLMDKEIAIPLDAIRDIDYRDQRIVIEYKDAKGRRFIDFDHFKSNDKALLEQFDENDARKLVEAVRVKIVTN